MLSDDTRLLAVPKTHGCITDLPSFAYAPLFSSSHCPSTAADFVFSLTPPHGFAADRNILPLLFRAGQRYFVTHKTGFFLLPPSSISQFLSVPHGMGTEHCLLSPAPIFCWKKCRKGIQPKQAFPPGRQEQSMTTNVFHLNANPAPADL